MRKVVVPPSVDVSICLSGACAPRSGVDRTETRDRPCSRRKSRSVNANSEVAQLVDWALPIQRQHLETVRTTSLTLAAEEDPNEAAE